VGLLPNLVTAEIVKLLSRLSAKMGLLASLCVGLAMPLFMLLLMNSGIQVNGNDASQYFAVTPNDTLVYALYVRSFPVAIRAFLVILGAQMLAGEFRARTLREDLLRPVPRWTVLTAKFAALMVWDAASLFITFGAAALIGVLAFGTDGAWLATVLAYFLALVCDAGVIAVVFAIGVLTRSTVATISSLIVFFVLDKMLGWAMITGSVVAMAAGVSPEVVEALNRWDLLPSTAFGSWASVLPESEVAPMMAPDYVVSWSAVALIWAACMLFSGLWMKRIDVP
jgi:ABC-type transport system involved in multi-copper enzyme maturation permease subunit